MCQSQAYRIHSRCKFFVRQFYGKRLFLISNPDQLVQIKRIFFRNITINQLFFNREGRVQRLQFKSGSRCWFLKYLYRRSFIEHCQDLQYKDTIYLLSCTFFRLVDQNWFCHYRRYISIYFRKLVFTYFWTFINILGFVVQQLQSYEFESSRPEFLFLGSEQKVDFHRVTGLEYMYINTCVKKESYTYLNKIVKFV